jgi:hypothetical protein
MPKIVNNICFLKKNGLAFCHIDPLKLICYLGDSGVMNQKRRKGMQLSPVKSSNIFMSKRKRRNKETHKSNIFPVKIGFKISNKTGFRPVS